MLENASWRTIGYGSTMALVDMFILSALKAKALGIFDGPWIVALSMLVYSFQPVIFLKSMQFETLTVMNLFWDLASDVLVTLSGLFVFGERLSLRRWLGVALSFISLCLLGC